MEIVYMVIAFPVRPSERTAQAMLRIMLDQGHIGDDGIFYVPLEDWEIDLLSLYGAPDADLEDGDDDEDDAASDSLT